MFWFFACDQNNRSDSKILRQIKEWKNQYFSKNKEKKFEFMYICIINYGNFFEVKKVFEKLIIYLKSRFQQVFWPINRHINNRETLCVFKMINLFIKHLAWDPLWSWSKFFVNVKFARFIPMSLFLGNPIGHLSVLNSSALLKIFGEL